MENKALPPKNSNGISRPGRGGIVIKPKNMKGTLHRLWDLTKGKRNGLGLIILLSGLTSASSIFSPLIIGNAVDAVNTGNWSIMIIVTLLAVYLSDWLLRFMQQFFMASISQRIIHHIRTILFNTVKKLPLSFFDKHRHGELMSRLTNDIDNISTTISNSLSLLLTYMFTIVGIFIIMVSLSPLLTAVSLIGTIFIFLLTKTITKRTKKLFANQQKALGALNGQVEESISGLAIVKIFCREQKMELDFEEKNNEFCSTATKALIWSGYLMPFMNVINNLCFVTIAVSSGIMAVNRLINIGMISTFLLYVRQFTRPFVEIANIYNSFQTAVAGAERIFEIIDESTEPKDLPEALSLNKIKGDIEFKNVSFGYTPEKMVLKNITLNIPAGTKVAVVGPTGSGKTTLVNLLNRFYEVSKGEILLDGNNIKEYKMKELRKMFSVVLQDTALFSISIKDNISYGQEDVPLKSIEEVAKIVGADPFIRRMPNGYSTILEQSGMELSQGERQLLTIARAILSNAPIMILDEATSSVDTVTELKIKQAMLIACEGRTSFIIAHRLSTIRDSDLIIVMQNGEITESGSHEELIKLNGHYAMMYRTQSCATTN